jgi:hypothetical protein
MIGIGEVIEFCRDELSIMDEVIVEVYLKDLTKDNVHGWCVDSSEFPGFGDNEYEIEIEETLNDDDMLVTLCHEMVHIRQYSEGNPSNDREAEELETVLAEKYKSI